MTALGIRRLPAATLVLALAPTGYVMDRAGLLNEETVAALNARLYQHEVETSNQVVVETVTSLGGTPIEEYSLHRASQLGIGQKAKDNGVLVVVARDERKVRIEVGYGLEGVLPDVVCFRIIRLEMTPRFREGNYDDGVTAGVDAILAAIRGEYEATPLDRLQAAMPGVAPLLDPLLDGSVFRNVPSVVQIVVGVFFWIFSAAWLFVGRVLGRVAGHPIRLGVLPGFALSALVAYAFPYTLVPLAVFAVMAIVNRFAPESARTYSGRLSGGSSSGRSWSSGSSSGSSYSSGSSGGGSFSGGGGSFGGGGASGSW